jgi:type III pantothenate kinase
MVLLIDLGNSRLKWCVSTDLSITDNLDIQYLVYQNTTFCEQLERCWHDLPTPETIYLSNVTNPTLSTYINIVCEKLWHKKVILARHQIADEQLRSAYAIPTQLGIDRWLALWAASYLYPKQMCLVVDCGTAMTLDVLSPTGQHQGGLIVPGVGLQWQLIQQADALCHLPTQLPPPTVLKLGHDTQSGVTMGIITALAANIERVYTDYIASTDPTGICLLSGGDSAVLAQHINVPHYLYENLVLRGLIYYAKLF